jgi:hypothetical protein
MKLSFLAAVIVASIVSLAAHADDAAAMRARVALALAQAPTLAQAPPLTATTSPADPKFGDDHVHCYCSVDSDGKWNFCSCTPGKCECNDGAACPLNRHLAKLYRIVRDVNGVAVDGLYTREEIQALYPGRRLVEEGTTPMQAVPQPYMQMPGPQSFGGFSGGFSGACAGGN